MKKILNKKQMVANAGSVLGRKNWENKTQAQKDAHIAMMNEVKRIKREAYKKMMLD